MAHQEQKGNLHPGEENNNAEPFRHVNGPSFSVRAEPVLDPMEWGKASRYLADLIPYLGPRNMAFRKEYQEPFTNDAIEQHFIQLGLELDAQQRVRDSICRVSVVPDWHEILQVREAFDDAWTACRFALGRLATFIAGTRDEWFSLDDMAEISAEDMRRDHAWRQVSRLLEEHFERALNGGKAELAYDARHMVPADKDAQRMMAEYPLVVGQLKYSVMAMIGTSRAEFDCERKLFVDAFKAMRRLPASTLAYLAKLEQVTRDNLGE